MSVIDPVADMLTRVRNACMAGHRRVDMPVSKLKVAIATILRDNHYVQDFKVLDDGRHGLLRLSSRFDGIGGPHHEKIGNSAQRSEMLDRLMRRPIFADADRIVREHVDD